MWELWLPSHKPSPPTLPSTILKDLLLSVLKRGSPALRAYHEEHPEYLLLGFESSGGGSLDIRGFLMSSAVAALTLNP